MTDTAAGIETIEIEATEGKAEAFLARPEASGPRPGVLLFMDAIGLRPRIAEMCRTVADWGYVVLAPNVFHRAGRIADLAPTEDLREPGARDRFFERIGPLMGTFTRGQSDPDTTAYLAALRGLDGVAGERVGVVGYCFGARLATVAAGMDPQVVAVGGFHGGGLATDEPDSPHRMLATATAEFVYGHADADRSMPPEAVAVLGDALENAGLTASNQIYPGAAHGYTMADTSSYHPEATDRHWRELRSLFGRALH